MNIAFDRFYLLRNFLYILFCSEVFAFFSGVGLEIKQNMRKDDSEQVYDE